MPNDWKPNAPNLKKNFEKANVQKQVKKIEPVTKVELNKLKNERPAPKLAGPTPPGGQIKNTNYQQKSKVREDRIKYIKERMGNSKEKMREGWDKAAKKPQNKIDHKR